MRRSQCHRAGLHNLLTERCGLLTAEQNLLTEPLCLLTATQNKQAEEQSNPAEELCLLTAAKNKEAEPFCTGAGPSFNRAPLVRNL